MASRNANSWPAPAGTARSTGPPDFTDAPRAKPAASPPRCACQSDPRSQKKRPLWLNLLLLPPRLARATFASVFKVTLAPVRATLGQTIPYSNRKHLMIVPEWAELLVGKYSFLLLKAKAKALSQGHGDTKLVKRVGERIVAALPRAGDGVGGYSEHLKHCNWEFVVLRSSEPNAMVVPGGKVVVYTGLLDLINRNEDKLAAVLGHEAAHVLARHGAERMAGSFILGCIVSAAHSAFRVSASANSQTAADERYERELAKVDRLYQRGSEEHAAAVASVQRQHSDAQHACAQTLQTADAGVDALFKYLVELPNSRKHETEADKVGLMLAHKARFDIRAAPAVWDDFARVQGSNQVLSLLSTHPASLQRKKMLEHEVAALARR